MDMSKVDISQLSRPYPLLLHFSFFIFNGDDIYIKFLSSIFTVLFINSLFYFAVYGERLGTPALKGERNSCTPFQSPTIGLTVSLNFSNEQLQTTQWKTMVTDHKH